MFEGSLLAIDIGSHAIKVAEISPGKSKRTVHNLGIKVLPPGVIVSGNIQDRLMVESALLELLKEMKVRRLFRRAAIVVSGSNVLVKRATMIPDETKDSGDQIFLEAEKQFQMDMNELYFDYYIDDLGTDSNEQVALMVGAKRETLNDRILIILNSGLKIGLVDCEAFALTNLIEFNFGFLEGLIAFINVGASSTNVIFLNNGHYAYSREIGIGGEHYTKVIAEALGINLDLAEEQKIQASMGQVTLDETGKKVIDNVHDQFISELHMAMDFFFQSGEAPVGRDTLKGVFLTGGGAQVLGFVNYMREKLKIPVEIIDPFQNMQISPKLRGVENLNFRSMFSVIAGLSLRSFAESRS